MKLFKIRRHVVSGLFRCTSQIVKTFVGGFSCNFPHWTVVTEVTRNLLADLLGEVWLRGGEDWKLVFCWCVHFVIFGR